MALLRILRNGFLALAAYVAIVVISSVAADYSYYRQTHVQVNVSHLHLASDGTTR
jgi:hypothetical protein